MIEPTDTMITETIQLTAGASLTEDDARRILGKGIVSISCNEGLCKLTLHDGTEVTLTSRAVGPHVFPWLEVDVT